MKRGSTHTGDYHYIKCQSPYYDSVNDIRETNVNGVFTVQRCTAANLVKGAGTWVADSFLKLDQSSVQTITQSPKINDLTPLKLVFIDSNKQIKSIDVLYKNNGDLVLKNGFAIRSLLAEGETEKVLLRMIANGTVELHSGGGGHVFKNAGNVIVATIDILGNITGANLSGTNTGDQDLSGLQLKNLTFTNVEAVVKKFDVRTINIGSYQRIILNIKNLNTTSKTYQISADGST